ncbi:MAG: chromosomal replication initiator protein DnaA [Gammaproteobacteria bacterium]|nr:chromosomal replication initiator protein DnaA [Gammaproteobacteria bacterium]
MDSTLWTQCIRQLEGQLSDQHLNTWIRPLQASTSADAMHLLAPNRFVLDWVKDHYLEQIIAALGHLTGRTDFRVELSIGSRTRQVATPKADHAALLGELSPTEKGGYDGGATIAAIVEQATDWEDTLNPEFTVETFVEGKSNQLARAAAIQVGQNPGGAYNPLCIYGSTGLGKTHLMHAIGNIIRERNPSAKIAYLRAERFVADMVKALQHNAMDQFKARYRTLNALLIDDIQFFANKERTQEEFFHTFNALLENQQQIIFTSDKYPKEVEGVDERLKSRFSWGLTTSIEPPDTETRVAILQSKAEQFGLDIPTDVAFFIANAVHSNVRELEGALRRVMANAHFMGADITVPFVKDALKDLLASQQKQVTVDNIQKTVANFYKVRLADLLSSRRSRSIARPRQIAMSLAKELTKHSYPEIGQSFGGRDHTTVIHACRKIAELRATDQTIDDDVRALRRLLTA